MKIRAFGWIQNPSDFSKLKLVVQVFDVESDHYRNLREEIISNVIYFQEDKERLLNLLNRSTSEFTYADLVGSMKNKKNKSTSNRKEAVADSLLQVTILPQTRSTTGKMYTDNWTADGFLRWAVSFNFIQFDRETDLFSITELGLNFSRSEDNSEEELEILRLALLRYPPATQVLSILANTQSWHTKFFIGNQLGFIGERGFTSYNEDLMIDWISNISDSNELKKVRANVEGTSDKYARMIANWLKKVGYVQQQQVRIQGVNGTITSFPEYRITGLGMRAYNRSLGRSSNEQIQKFVMWEFFATTANNRNYVRSRRAYILKIIENRNIRFSRLISDLRELGFHDKEEVIKNDIRGINMMGIRVRFDNSTVELLDSIVDFDIPDLDITSELQNIQLEEKKVMFLEKTNLSPRYIDLIEIACDGNRNRDFEIISVELLKNIYGFEGLLLGGGRKPDGIVYTDDYGVIIDTKAYSSGYSKSISEEDKMVRYIMDNKNRDVEINNTRWWEGFSDNIEEDSYYYLWISSKFIGQFESQLTSTFRRTGVNGAALGVEGLLWGADAIMKGNISLEDIPNYMNNSEIRCLEIQ